MPSVLLWIFVATIILAFSPIKSLWILFMHTALWAGPSVSYVVAFLCGVFFLPLVKRLVATSIRANVKGGAGGPSLYGLDHGRLHLELPDAMWMNMGFWKDRRANDESPSSPKILAEACRDLLIEVFTTAGITAERASYEVQRGTKKTTCVIDLGFGCGDQTACMMGTVIGGKGRLESGTEGRFTGGFDSCFEHYVGLTLDKKQYQFAVERIQPSSPIFSQSQERRNHTKIDMFRTDAAKPELWSAELKACLQDAINKSEERWVLALDTAYHFSPSRWLVIKHACQTLDSSFVSFDLCVSPTATFRQKLLLRVLTSLMGAPWTNFVTPDEYRAKLIESGYTASGITIRDISEDVFGPLAAYLGQQDRNLRVIGLGIGPFNVARLLFGWWARSGVVRGVIVVAKRAHE